MRVFISYSSKDGEFVRRLVKDFNRAGLDIDIDQTSFMSGQIWKDQARKLIDDCDIFLLILSNYSVLATSKANSPRPAAAFSETPPDANAPALHRSDESASQSGADHGTTTTKRLADPVAFEFEYARSVRAKALITPMQESPTGRPFWRETHPEIIPLLIYGNNVPDDLELQNTTYEDFRDIARYQHAFDHLLASMGVQISEKSRSDLHYRIAVLDPHPGEVVRLESHIFSAIERSVEPIKKHIEELVTAQRQQSWIMSTDMIAVLEVQAKSEIWVVTTHLWNDVNDEKIRESVKRNMQRHIRYCYFVRGSLHMERRIKEYKALYSEYHSPNDYQFVILKDTDLLMPFDEVVIYDPMDDMTRWGYVQMSWHERPLFIKLGEKNVSGIFNQLEKFILFKSSERGT